MKNCNHPIGSVACVLEEGHDGDHSPMSAVNDAQGGEWRKKQKRSGFWDVLEYHPETDSWITFVEVINEERADALIADHASARTLAEALAALEEAVGRYSLSSMEVPAGRKLARDARALILKLTPDRQDQVEEAGGQ